MDAPATPKSPSALRSCLVLMMLGCCSCCMLFDCLGYLDSDNSEPPLFASPTDLGTVLVPGSTSPDGAQRYTWSVEGLDPSWHQVRYGLGASLITEIEQDDEEFGRRMHFKPISAQRFTFRAPPDCLSDMRCIYAELMRLHSEPVEELGEHFLTFIRTQGLDSAQAANLIIGFVQRIHYELPGADVPFGVFPPALVPAKNAGDCDSKAVLAVMLLRQAGIDAAILYSDTLEHAAVGVGLPGNGWSINEGGRAWRYVEVTAEGWPIGMIPPQYDKPQQWTVVPQLDPE